MGKKLGEWRAEMWVSVFVLFEVGTMQMHHLFQRTKYFKNNNLKAVEDQNTNNSYPWKLRIFFLLICIC